MIDLWESGRSHLVLPGGTMIEMEEKKGFSEI